MDVSVAVDTTFSDETWLASGCLALNTVLEAVRPVVVAVIGVAFLAQTGRPGNQEVFMVTPVHVMACQTVLRDRWMLEGIGSPFVCVALVAKVGHRFGSYHLVSK
jgi:hypothetical protein